MTKFKSEELLNELISDVKNIREAAEYFRCVDKSKMVYCPAEGKWSPVQILEHLNAYGRYYLPEIEKVQASKPTKKTAWFNPGFFGNYFTNSMKPKNVYEVGNKMKSMKSYSFPNSLNVDTVLNEFREQQDTLIRLLERSRDVDLNELRIPVTISRMLRLKLGDVFRFIVAHEQRHMIQARNTLKSMGMATDKFPVILQVTPR